MCLCNALLEWMDYPLILALTVDWLGYVET